MKHLILALVAISLYPAIASAGHHNGFGFFFSIGGGGGGYCAAPACDVPCYGADFVSPGWRRTYECTPHYYTAAPVYCEPRVAVVASPVIVYRSPVVVYSPRVYYATPYTSASSRSSYDEGCWPAPRISYCYPR
jgi:hypothetical protein